MTRRSAKLEPLPWSTPAFWRGVEHEIVAAEPGALAHFEGAVSLPIELRAGFERELWERLRIQLGI